MSESHDRLGRFETLGAWLGVWTPHRDAVVPPVPWRRILIWGAVLLVVLGAVAAVAVPRLLDSKHAGERREAQRAAAARAREHARLERDQAAHRGTGPHAAQALYRKAQAAVLADARARAAAGSIDGPIRALNCVPVPAATKDAYNCTAVTDFIDATKHNSGGALGYPFRLILDAGSGRFVWCKQNPLAGERSVPRPESVVPLPVACQA
jgi:type II secretory pathway pseudopilin PulG